MEKTVKKVGEFVFDGMVFVVVSWGGEPAAYIPSCCGIFELSGWGFLSNSASCKFGIISKVLFQGFSQARESLIIKLF